MPNPNWDKQIERFFRHEAGFLDASSELNWQPMRKIVEGVRNSSPYTNITHLPQNACRILYDCIPASGPRQRQIFTDKQLFQNQEPKDARRTTYYITDVSPFCLATLGVKENQDFVYPLRQYLHSHVSGEIFLGALKPRNHNASPQNMWPRHVATSRKFTYEFHFRYVALRNRGDTLPDPRRFRKWYPFITSFDPDRDLYEENGYDLGCYDAQVSLLVIGRDEKNWKAYCTADAWIDKKPIQEFLDEDLEAPAADARKASDPCLDPREYFLLVLAQRIRHLAHEWGNVSTALLNRLSAYEAHYLQTIDDPTADLHDDCNLTRTRTYLKAASMLRHFHDTLLTTLNCFNEFMEDRENEGDDLYTKQEDFQDRCGCYESLIKYHLMHLTRFRNRFKGRMERFESMRNSMMTASLLRENRQATKQSQDIELLTTVTVFYLPLSLAATLMGMSTSEIGAKVWGAWLGIMALLALPTYWPLWRMYRARLKPKAEAQPIWGDARRTSQPLMSYPPP